MKYGELNLGQTEALVNKLGGMAGVKRVLSGKMVLTFKVWKTIKLGTHKDVDALKQAIVKAGFQINTWANDILINSAFSLAVGKKEVQLVKVSVDDLGFKEGTTYNLICARAKELGLELCSFEVGPQLRLQYKDQSKYEWLRIAMESSISAHPNFSLSILEVIHDNFGLWLNWCPGEQDNFWQPEAMFVFCIQK